MIEIGKINNLIVSKHSTHGVYLKDEDSDEEVLLPNAFVDSKLSVDDVISVFIYKDSEDRIVATTETPKLFLGQFELLRIKDVTKVGAFADWGLQKDLLIPYSEQKHELEVGEEYIVHLYLDEQSKRLVGSTKIRKHLQKEGIVLTPGDEVDLMAFDVSDMGVSVIVNEKYSGMVYDDEIYEPLEYGEKLKGYVKKVREDGRLDITLRKFGYKKVSSESDKILKKLNENNGFLNLHDKSSPEEISNQLKMSKKVFKKAIGDLYKRKKIKIEKDGIRLIS